MAAAAPDRSRPHGYSARQFIERTLETTAPIRGAPRTRAYLDVVRLAFDMDPCNAPFEVDALATYVGECAAALQLVPDDRRGPVAHELFRATWRPSCTKHRR